VKEKKKKKRGGRENVYCFTVEPTIHLKGGGMWRAISRRGRGPGKKEGREKKGCAASHIVI